MEDTIVILISTIAFILVLLNSYILVLAGLTLGVICFVLSLVIKNLTIITKVSTLILTSVTVILGVLWLILIGKVLS